ncbi:S-adenosyl-L-methionine-dependent methyltransferase [Cercophora scortea]|uniref:S-adenosyl-L-methionine-dependent methyltransferase n=1 Tax=Cercophora scortea TaxID=314031 RepID=A0AAE0I400_9PEZI|nr:S-adenosyl-L-methionine-dependent methyltransferase [Cercophora scortea]
MATTTDATAAADSAQPTPLSAEALFDTVGPAYEDAFAGLPTQAASIDWLLYSLKEAGIHPAKTLDIGCGTGKPVCSALADAGHDVLGIDVSGAMITAAQQRVPNATFFKLDIRDLNATPASYDAATAYFSLIAGVTQDEIRSIIAQVYALLKPGGFFVWSTVPLPADNLQIAWMGQPLVASSLPPDEAVRAVKNAGFEVIKEEVSTFLPKAAEAGICKAEEVWEETHLFVYARKPL